MTAPLCPSAQPDLDQAVCIGVRGGTGDQPLVRYLETLVVVDQELVQLAAPVGATEVFRFAAPCAESKCQHFDGEDCTLVDRLVETSPAVELAPRCAIRRDCRWWRQRGIAACRRCPAVITQDYSVRPELRAAAVPPDPSAKSSAR